MNIIVTGSGGLIGQRLCKHLIKEGNAVLEVDRVHGGDIEYFNFNERFKLKVDLIIHLASNCLIREIIDEPILAFDNVRNHFNIYELARKLDCENVVYFSSSRVYHHEENPYTVSKKFGEALANAYFNCYDINSLIIRPETVWAMDDKKERVITRWIKDAMNNHDICVYGDKEKELSPIHVDDFVAEFIKLLDTFLLSGGLITQSIAGKTLKVTDIIDIIKRVTESKSEVDYCEEELAQPQSCFTSDIEVDNFEKNVRDEIDKI